jgi:hypothetical protein
MHIAQTMPVLFGCCMSRQKSLYVQGYIAIDDVSIHDGKCAPAGTCDFEESDTCTWKQVKTGDELDWTLNKGSTGSAGTGPSADHTKGDAFGKYIYLESSAPARRGERAQLVSTTFSGWNNKVR